MKESGVSKLMKTKLNFNSVMEAKSLTLCKPRASRSLVQVDEAVHFVVNDDELDFSITTPNEKSIELSRKTYSKRNPIVCQSVFSQQNAEKLEVISLQSDRNLSSVSKSSAATSGIRTLMRKRKRDLDNVCSKNSVSKKGLKRSTVQSYARQPGNRLLNTSVNKDCSSDSDIEVLAVKICKPSPNMEAKSTNGTMKRFLNNHINLNNKKGNKCFESEAKKELVMNEADIAPFMPTNPNIFPDSSNRANSMRWLNSNGIISVPGYSQGFAQNGEVRVENTEVQIVSDAKLNSEKKPKGKRELKHLYDNLNEISWAHEKSFKNLLRRPDYIRHSERSSGRVAGTGKNLRKFKSPIKAQTKGVKQNTAANMLARKKSKIARLNRTQKVKQAIKHKLIPRVPNKKKVEKQATMKKKTIKSKLPSLSISSTDDENEIKYSLASGDKVKHKFPSDSSKMKMGSEAKVKAVVSKTKIINGPKLKPVSSKSNSDTRKVKFNPLKLKPDEPKTKGNGKPKHLLTQIKPDVSLPSTSTFQKGACSSKNNSHSKLPNMNQCVKNLNLSFSQQMQIIHSMSGRNENHRSGAPKLRVRLQPLEHTKLWTPEYYEELRKLFLEQAVRRVLESHDIDSAQLMLQGMLDSHNSNGSGGNNNRVPKKRKQEEEALRSSVRQSEGAFRYKEIVVKRQPNYMQVVLVPNEGKQNILTVEAIKELKDAFLLAKKDPNCRAVLLNSSGNYFCTGVDLSPLVGPNKKQAAEELSSSIQDLVVTLSMFTKPVVAAVNGDAFGFGVSLLTYCDVVLASDKATFCLPAAKMGYIPEGGITLTLPQVVGSTVASEMFLQGRRLTAEQAYKYGLVSEVLWPTRLMNEVIPRLKNIISQPLQAMEATKAMVRCNVWDKLKPHMENERILLCQHWLGPQCQASIKIWTQTGWLVD